MSDQLLVIPIYVSKIEHMELLDKCLASIKATVNNPNILIVDDCSPNEELFFTAVKEGWADYIRNDENSGFAKSVNKGLVRACEQGIDAVLVNQDIEFIEHGWLQQMASNDAAVIGAKLVYENDIIQHGGVYFSQITRSFDHRFKGSISTLPEANKPANCPVTGALQYIKLDTLKKVGYYDETFYMGYEDVDYCIRVNETEGLNCLYDPKVKAIHHESLIRGGHNIYQQGESYLTFVRKYNERNFYEIAPTMFEPTEFQIQQGEQDA